MSEQNMTLAQKEQQLIDKVELSKQEMKKARLKKICLTLAGYSGLLLSTSRSFWRL
ncbi:hypothetical protein [Vibrio algarum]|uniref:Mobilization protein n=1 Tax=Vibrio algarum TaxID=3020714 RepID=A0ABT4YWH8_9VIBR|nr:hypothetical protein [Vibrio sp. KJ40-1]MDB1125338.1 hypothetical protein [Vibrio sp. KJ40-1]